MTINLSTERYASDDKSTYTPGSATTAGTPVLLGNGLVGIPPNDIAAATLDELDVNGLFRAWGIASQAWAVGDTVGWDADADPLNGTAGTGAYTKTVANWNFLVGVVEVAKGATDEMGVVRLSGSPSPIPSGAKQAISGAGAIDVVSYFTAWTTTGAQAGTLADGTHVGQLKEIQLIVDGGDGTLTPATFADGTTITFSNAGDNVLLRWTPDGWTTLRSVNYATGAGATPVIA